MNKLRLISPIPPSVNNYLNYRITRNGRKSFVQAYPSEETVAYKSFFIDYVKNQIQEQGWKRPDKGKQVYVRLIFYLDRKRKDPNNLLKVPFDALTEAGVYHDDDIALAIMERTYIDVDNPRIEIEIFESEAIGVFKNQEELETFLENNCKICKKDEKKCGIMKKLLDNRIIPEVKDGICSKRK